MSSTAFSYASGPSGKPLLGLTIGQQLEATAAAFSGQDALVDVPSGQRWTYQELNVAVDRLATGLLDLGVQKGDRVGIWATNVPEWVVVQYATAKVGAILVTINPAYRSHETAYVLNQSGIRTLIAVTSHKSSDYVASVQELRPDCPELKEVFFIGSEEWQHLATAAYNPVAVAERLATLDRDDSINIQYTSGTTGFPKGATLSHHNILNNGYFITELLHFTEQDRVCAQVPFYHCFGMVEVNLGCLSHGSCVVIPSTSFEPGASLAAIDAESCTAVFGVPTMFIAMLNHANFPTTNVSSLRTGIMSGSPCPVSVMKQVVNEMHLPEITITYGMTETSPVTTHTRIDASLERRVSSVGTPHPHVEIKIVGPGTGLTVPRGEAGELCARGYVVMRGYWREPQKTAEAVDEAGWMHTGDLATMDEEDYINIVGRSKDMVIRGGENIYPREIEEFLYSHPDIADVQVVGVPDPKYGEELCAWIQLREGRDAITAEALREFCRGKIAHYKIPRYVHIAAEFPMTPSGKVRKVAMRDESVKVLGLEPAAPTA